MEPEIIYGTRYDTPKIIEARKQSISIPETINIKTPKRITLRNTLANEFYGEGASIKEKRLDLVLGPPASGKSSKLVDPLAKKYGSIIIDSDKIKELLPEYINGIGSRALHKESSLIADEMILEKALINNDNIVSPRLGKNSKTMETLIDKFAKSGYKVHLHYIDLPIDKAVKRAITRFNETGRFIDPYFILNDVDRKTKVTYNEVKNMEGVISYEAYSNDVPKGQEPTLIERVTTNVNTTGAKRLQRQFSNKDIKQISKEEVS